MMRKKYRVYYNDKKAFPLVWSIDEGTPETERNFAAIDILAMSFTAFDMQRQPHAWLDVRGELEVFETFARII